ncbi:uncharacterized protein LOC141948046 [Strix uralensis]|uniref:uncharacterized protein LOC141948046 n=1 Tax=Strix uralensis TaxID=36305 RepID=UPI003DA3C368
MEAGAGGAVVSASARAGAASAQGRPGRCWVGSCSGCSLPRLCALASLGQGRARGSRAVVARPHGTGVCPAHLSLLGLGKAPLCHIPARFRLAGAGNVSHRHCAGCRHTDSPRRKGQAQRVLRSRALRHPAKRPLLAAVSVQNLHLCEGYVGPGGRYHPGFYCPRLSDPASHRYCCRPSPRALKSCCSQPALEALIGVNLSSLAGPGLLRNPLALPFVGLYGLLVLLLMAVDLFHFYRTRRCHLGRLLPRTCRLPRRPPGGHQTCSRTPRGPGGLLLPPRGRAC